MRYFLFLAFFLPIFAQAHELKIPAKGVYNFSTQFEVLMKKRFETVYGFTDSGRERISFLRADGYICNNTGREIFLCSGFLPEQGTESEIRASVLDRMQSINKVEFDELRSEPSIISEGSALKTWQVEQKVEFAGKSYNGYRYLVGDGFEKIFLGEPAEQTFEILGNQKLGFPFILNETDSREVYRKYLVMSLFQ